MAVTTPSRLDQRQLTTTTETTLYTTPASTKVIVKQVVITNTSATAAVCGLSLVPTGGAAGAANRIIPDLASIPVGGLITFDLALVMNAGDFLSAKAGTASAVNVSIHGITIV